MPPAAQRVVTRFKDSDKVIMSFIRLLQHWHVGCKGSVQAENSEEC